MYSSCIFCYRGLGHNVMMDAFRVGSRIAFDPAKGRLWVVCPTCGRWNLSPLEERWEAIEAAERTYGAGALRARTENVSLAKAADGTELIRIGAAPHLEIASWRYGDRFVRRWKKTMAYSALAVGASGAFFATGTFAALMAVPAGGILIHASTWLSLRHLRRRVVARIRQPAGHFSIVRGEHLDNLRLLTHPIDGWALRVEHEEGTEQLRGIEALTVAGPLLAHLNLEGARPKTVGAALAHVESFPTPDMFLQHLAVKNQRRPGDWAISKLGENTRPNLLAMEMIAHDVVERAALVGELTYLERAWREAEEIAAISDDLLIPTTVANRLRVAQQRVESD